MSHKHRYQCTERGQLTSLYVWDRKSSHSLSGSDWIAVVTAYILLFPAELMKVGIRHQAESQPRVSKKIQKPVELQSVRYVNGSGTTSIVTVHAVWSGVCIKCFEPVAFYSVYELSNHHNYAILLRPTLKSICNIRILQCKLLIFNTYILPSHRLWKFCFWEL